MIERDRIRTDSRGARTVLEALEAGIAAAQPSTVLADSLSLEGDRLRVADATYDLARYDDVVVLGGGNAAGEVAGYLADLLGDRVATGVVVTDDPAEAGPVRVIEGSHPIPDENNRQGAADLLELARRCDESTLALVAVTGGGSALLPVPADGISLGDLRDLTDALLRSGAPIDRINAVRKHVSSLKGGRLARALAPADSVGLVFSDVTSDDPSVVASGPLSPDATTYEDALAVLDEFDVAAPSSIERYLRDGAAGRHDETPSDDDPAFDRVTTHVLADGYTALSAARDACERDGYETLVLSSSVRGEARETAKVHVAVAEEIHRTGNPLEPPAAVLSGGETTVTVTDEGHGGPNQEFALSAAVELSENAVLGAVDTDGIDGPTDAAGALVDCATVEDRRTAERALADHDAYEFLADRGVLVFTGQTGTNVNDLRIAIIPE